MADIILAVVALAVLVVLVLLAGFLTWRGFRQGEAAAVQERQVGVGGDRLSWHGTMPHQAVPPPNAAGRRRLGRGLRQRRGYALDGSDRSDDDDDPAPVQEQPTKEDKRRAYDQRRAQREAEREAAEAAALAELQRAEDARRAKEEQEAARWLHLISTEGEGQDAQDGAEGQQSLLSHFVDYIQQSKMVALDELAAEFRLPTAQVIQRIGDLETSGTLTGIMDDRGKYVYISMEELKGVAEYIKGRGRVSIAELAAKSARLIDLEPRQAQRAGGAGVELDLDLSEEEEE